ncbi:MarR family winged helix-turn-helix transcriptional regulator [Desulfosudis oleivorans]|uniref:Transcriptional regulator, MarR family n=1 Tax=Desulfosudis oleivorans (strain DSM 6200 / JCM 39069 / Hxd3) TaxID=96561 RepID=A9A0W5_DESOH|nr:MarR family transcriptional regulator [Desulfosudis oleivorans]ABW67590.1 transcriptional regulator, MarR family [Desulfosudis oleivorans Hxd3]
MADKLGKMIDQLWFRVQLFIETSGGRQGAGELSERDFILLDYLDRKGEAGFSELSDFFKKVSPSTMSGTLKKLNQKKLVARREDPRDLRANIFSLTPKGRQSLEPVRQSQAELSQIIADSLQLTPEESNLVAEAVVRANKTFDKWMGLSDLLEPDKPDEHT